MKMDQKTRVRMLTSMAMLSAVAVILVAIIHFPLFPAAPFLEYDPADIMIWIGTFAYGPAAGLIMTVVVSVIQGLTVSAQSGIIGIIMHIFATGGFVLLAGNIYKRDKSKKGAVKALVCGSLLMVVMMILWNILITPIYMGVDRSLVIDLLVPAIIPFNIIKAAVNSLITFLVYKRISKFLHNR